MKSRLGELLRRPVAAKATARYALLVLFAAVMLVSILYEMQPADAGPSAPLQVTVQPGDTLWGLAAGYGPHNADVRTVVAQIRRLNRLDGSLIHPGQMLLVPQG